MGQPSVSARQRGLRANRVIIPPNFALPTANCRCQHLHPSSRSGVIACYSARILCLTTVPAPTGAMPFSSLNPTSVTISGAAAQTSTLTVITTAASSAENQHRNLLWPSTCGATFAFVLLFVKPRKRKNRFALIGLLLLFVSAGLIACGGGTGAGGGGGGSTGTTPGAYTITVTGTSGSVSATVGVVALTVQ
jgi:trimeric autotransporter adhesin